MPSLLWFRRDLRTVDHPALAAAFAAGPTLPCFVLEPEMLDSIGTAAAAWLAATLAALDHNLEHHFGGRLHLAIGDPETVIPRLAAAVGATSVHVSAHSEPERVARDRGIRAALGRVAWVETGSNYAVSPGRVSKADGSGFAVFTAFERAWRAHGWPEPATNPSRAELITLPSDPAVHAVLERARAGWTSPLPPAGQEAAADRWDQFRRESLAGYADLRDRPDLDRTSRLSADLALGAIHPRTLLAELAGDDSPGAVRFRTELAWREFYADVLWRHPNSQTGDLHPLRLAYDEPGEAFTAWRHGRTGFPIVDAGQRQLLATGWMHNRVRMISASFLTKDLHLWWPHGAAHFARHLIDLDIASNVHGWQWVAGTGTDAAPYFRVFNPTAQAERFDPAGDYVRRWVPELSHLAGAAVHRPWAAADGYRGGYPRPLVDHDKERREALARYRLARQG